jgi:phage gpG-like protein
MVAGGFHLTITTEGETVVERHLMRFAQNMEHPHHALDEVGVVMREAVERQFASEGGYASGGWKRLTPERVAFKRKHGLDPHILRATDRLMASLTRKFDADHIERPSGDALVFGSMVPYGVFHQSSRPRTKIPFRPPVAITPQDKRRMVKRVQAALLQGVEKQTWGA